MGMLKCTRCGIEYEAELGSAKRCPDCREYGRSKQAEYTSKRREKMKAAKGLIAIKKPKKEPAPKKEGTYYQRNKERLLAQSKENYYKNKETRLEYAKNYYRKNKEKITEYQKEYRKKYQALLKDAHDILRHVSGERYMGNAVDVMKQLLDDI